MLDVAEDRAVAMDRHVGARIRQRRRALGVSQQELAVAIGVTYQQENKYERGLNRISAGRLAEVARALRAPVGWFFENGEEPMAGLLEGIGDDRAARALRDLAAALARGAGSPSGGRPG